MNGLKGFWHKAQTAFAITCLVIALDRFIALVDALLPGLIHYNHSILYEFGWWVLMELCHAKREESVSDILVWLARLGLVVRLCWYINHHFNI